MKIFDPTTEFPEAVAVVDRFLLESPVMPMAACLAWVEEMKKPVPKKIGMEDFLREAEEE